MADEPMTDERLAEIQALVANINERGRYSGAVSPSEVIYASDASLLLAEIDRLRAREAAAMAIVRAVAANSFPGADPGVCPFCEKGILHKPDCPVTKARALLAQE